MYVLRSMYLVSRISWIIPNLRITINIEKQTISKATIPTVSTFSIQNYRTLYNNSINSLVYKVVYRVGQRPKTGVPGGFQPKPGTVKLPWEIDHRALLWLVINPLVGFYPFSAEIWNLVTMHPPSPGYSPGLLAGNTPNRQSVPTTADTKKTTTCDRVVRREIAKQVARTYTNPNERSLSEWVDRVIVVRL